MENKKVKKVQLLDLPEVIDQQVSSDWINFSIEYYEAVEEDPDFGLGGISLKRADARCPNIDNISLGSFTSTSPRVSNSKLQSVIDSLIFVDIDKDSSTEKETPEWQDRLNSCFQDFIETGEDPFSFLSTTVEIIKKHVSNQNNRVSKQKADRKDLSRDRKGNSS